MTQRDAKPANVANPASALAPLAGIADGQSIATRDAKGRFLSGNIGGGRPTGSRNRLTDTFLSAIADDFAANGLAAIAQVRETDPAMYLRIIAAIVPRELVLQREQQPSTDYADLSYDEAAALINAERKRKLIRGAIEGA